MERPEGFQPPTFWLETRCSNIELRARKGKDSSRLTLAHQTIVFREGENDNLVLTKHWSLKISHIYISTGYSTNMEEYVKFL